MVTLPQQFVAVIQYPGYFWNMENRCLYSLKSGVLKKLVRKIPNTWSDLDGYLISHQGIQRCLTMKQLDRLVSRDSIIPVKGD